MTNGAALLLLLAAITPVWASDAAPGEYPVRQVVLVDRGWLATEELRTRLKYLASCALDEGTVLVSEQDGVSYRFPGGIGLAPQWVDRGLTLEEERWVSACILARTNYFGVPVRISLRSSFPTPAPGLQVSEAEAAGFPVKEATFFGDLFRPEAVAYVCGDNDTAARKALLGAHRRVCGVPTDEPLPDGRRVTACGFIYLGPCSPERFVQEDQGYRQAITVYLPAEPAAPE